MTLKMQEKIANAIEKATSSEDNPKALLLAGHSAGGAVAQILYALSMVEGSIISRAVHRKF